MRVHLFLVLLLVGLAGCKAPEQDDLHAFTRRGDLARMQSALDTGVDINQLKGGVTALHEAVERGHEDAVQWLLEKGADPGVKDAKGRTPWEALFADHPTHLTSLQSRAAAALVEGGARVGHPPDRGLTYLHVAARSSDSGRLMKALLDKGEQKVDARDENGWTPLHYAALGGHGETAAALLAAGAEVNAESTANWEKTVRRGKSDHTEYRYEAGSRPLDVANIDIARGRKSVSEVLKEWGGTSNDKVHNLRH